MTPITNHCGLTPHAGRVPRNGVAAHAAPLHGVPHVHRQTGALSVVEAVVDNLRRDRKVVDMPQFSLVTGVRIQSQVGLSSLNGT